MNKKRRKAILPVSKPVSKVIKTKCQPKCSNTGVLYVALDVINVSFKRKIIWQ